MFFVRYDVDGDFQFNNSETGRILDDLDHNRVERVPETSNETDLTRYYKGYQKIKLSHLDVSLIILSSFC